MGRWSRRTRVELLILLGGFAMFTFFGGCASQLMLFPSRGPEDAQGAQRLTIPFQGRELEIWTARSPTLGGAPPQAYILSFTGNAGRAEWHPVEEASDWGKNGVEVWAINHPGFGGSTGPARLSRLAPAAIAAYDALSTHSKGKPIFISGMSLGTAMALHVAANRPVAGLILRSPPPLRNLIMCRHGWWNLWLLATPVALGVPSELDSLANGTKVKAPALFVLTDTDEVVPLNFQQKVFAAYGGAKRVVTIIGGDHNAMMSRPTRGEYLAALDWLWNAASANVAGATSP